MTGSLSTAIVPAADPWTDGTDVCALEDIPVLGARRVGRADGVEIAIFRTAADRVYAVRDRCAHKGGPLSQGIVFGDRVACPLHNWTFDLSTGRASAPDEGTLERFAVRVDPTGRVWLALHAPIGATK